MDDVTPEPDLLDAATELGAALREALEVAVSTTAPPAARSAAAAAIRAAMAPLTGQPRPLSELPPLDNLGQGVRFFSPVIGPGSGMAPPLRLEQEGGRVVARFVAGQMYEGPPTFLHGGVSSMLMDQVLGEAAIVFGQWGMTAGLTLRYRRPVPLQTPLLLFGQLSEIAGRRTIVTGGIATEQEPEAILVEATGTFVSPSPATAAAYFGSVRSSDDQAANGHLGVAQQT